MENLFSAVILSDEPGRRGDRTRSRRTPLAASNLKLVAAPRDRTVISRSYRGSLDFARDRLFDSAPARPAKEAGQKFFAGARSG